LLISQLIPDKEIIQQKYLSYPQIIFLTAWKLAATVRSPGGPTQKKTIMRRPGGPTQKNKKIFLVVVAH